MTLRRKVILAFGLITIPLVSFLLYSNYYSSQVVRDQVASYNSGLLSLYGDQIDQTLETGNSYLYRLANQDPDIRSLVYNQGQEDEYALTKIRVTTKLYADFPYNKNMYMDFVFIPDNEDLITAQPRQKSYAESVLMETFLKELFVGTESEGVREVFEARWTSCTIGDDKFLLRIVGTDTNTFVGALIKLDDLMTPLALIARDRSISAYFLDSEGNWLMPGPAQDASEGVVKAVQSGNNIYQTVRGEEKYLLVDHRMSLSNLVMAVMIPEKVMLQQVPLFQRIGYVIPFAAGGLLLIFLAYLQKLLILPMQRLIKGMRQLSRGNLDTRLSAGPSSEFTMIGDTFNNMVSEISDLKIHVYEEEIRSQKAELRQLQLQMNPHFLFNSLNIIYNLAETGKVDLIKQMARHMVGYLRFFARLKDHLITVREELENVDHYMHIQKLRFPKHLAYECSMDETVRDGLLPPLTVQPFVENALKHGFSTGKDIFKVSVTARLIESDGKRCCEIRIEDNGRGFQLELVERLQEMMNDDAYTREHIGIWNVYNHLKMLYHGEAELRIANLEPQGASVVIVIPLRLIGQEGETQHVQSVDR